VALPLELLVLKRCAAQRAGDVALEADLAPARGQGLAVALAKHDAGVDTIAQGHDQSREHVPSLAQDNLEDLLLSPLLELSPDML